MRSSKRRRKKRWEAEDNEGRQSLDEDARSHGDGEEEDAQSQVASEKEENGEEEDRLVISQDEEEEGDGEREQEQEVDVEEQDARPQVSDEGDFLYYFCLIPYFSCRFSINGNGLNAFFFFFLLFTHERAAFGDLSHALCERYKVLKGRTWELTRLEK